MKEDKPFRLWPKADDQAFIAEMIRDSGSKHWEELSEFVKQLVHAQAKNISPDHHEKIIQGILLKVVRALPGFQFRSALTSWLTPIITHNIIDMVRELDKEKIIVALEAQFTEDDQEGGVSPVSEAKLLEKTKSAEDIFIEKEDLRRAYELMEEYLKAHAHLIRNAQIIRMVLEEGYTYEETAKAVGCNPPVVGYVVREVQRYVRERMKPQQP